MICNIVDFETKEVLFTLECFQEGSFNNGDELTIESKKGDYYCIIRNVRHSYSMFSNSHNIDVLVHIKEIDYEY